MNGKLPDRATKTTDTRAPEAAGASSGGLAGMLAQFLSQAGNRAVTGLVAGTSSPVAPGGSASSVSVSPKPDAGGGGAARPLRAGRTVAAAAGAGQQATRAAALNDYGELLNAFQDMAAAAMNRRGKGLDRVALGPDLSAGHRALLEDVRRVLIDADRTGPSESRQSAAADWPKLAVRLETSLQEARRAGVRGGVIAAAADDIAMLGEHYVGARIKGAPQAESADDYTELMRALGQLMSIFAGAPEAAAGSAREEVQGRPDAAVSLAIREINAHQQAALSSVQLGAHMSNRHRALAEELRAVLLIARGMTPGSAARAVARWRSIRDELRYVVERAPNFVSGDLVDKAQLDALGDRLAEHYALVHREDIGVALRTAAQPGETEADHLLQWAVAGAAVDPKEVNKAVTILEARRFRDLGRAVTVIEKGIAPMPGHPGEWLLTSGSTQVRLRGDEVEELRTMAAIELATIMARLVTRMVDASQVYEGIKRNSSFKLHVLGGWGGATDPGDMDHWRNSLISVRDTLVYPRIRDGKFVDAYQAIMSQKAIVEARSKEVADYDSDLDLGYSRLSTAMQIGTVVLTSLVPGLGEVAVVKFGYSVFAVGGAAVAAGAGGALLAETGRELLMKEGVDPSKIFKATRGGAGIGLTTITGPTAKAFGGAMGGGVLAETTANALVNAGQAFVAGEPVVPALVGGGIGGFGGRYVSALQTATGSRVVGALASTGLGVTQSLATGTDPVLGGIGSGIGHVGGVAAQHDIAAGAPAVGREPPPAPPSGGGGAGGGGSRPPSGDVPHPEGGIPVEIGPEGDAVYHGPAISTGIPEVVIDDASTARQPVSPFDPTPATGVPVPVDDPKTAPHPVDPLDPTPATGVPVPIDDPKTASHPVDPLDPTPATGVPVPIDDDASTARQPVSPFEQTPATGVPVPIDDDAKTTPVPDKPSVPPEPDVKPPGRRRRGGGGTPPAGRPPPPAAEVAAFRAKVLKALRGLRHGTGSTVNDEWTRVRPQIDRLPDTKANNRLKAQVDKVFAAVRDPEVIADVMVEIWLRSRADGITTEEALKRIASDRPDVPAGTAFPEVPKNLTVAELVQPLPFVDLAFLTDVHGAYTHMVQELAVARALGGLSEAAEFRKELTLVTDPPGFADPTKRFWERCWDALFDSEDIIFPLEAGKGHINRPEELGPVLHTHLGLPGAK